MPRIAKRTPKGPPKESQETFIWPHFAPLGVILRVSGKCLLYFGGPLESAVLANQNSPREESAGAEPVLAWEREARLHGARVAYVTRAARSFNRFTFSTKSPEIPQRTARRSISHAVDRSASSLAALARSLRSLDGGIGH